MLTTGIAGKICDCGKWKIGKKAEIASDDAHSSSSCSCCCCCYWCCCAATVVVIIIGIIIIICQIIKDRVLEQAVRSSFTWNTEPGSLMILPEFSQSLNEFPFYWRHLRVSADTNSSSLFTAVVYVTSRSSFYSASPLHRLMRALSKSSKLHKVIGLWSVGIFRPCPLWEPTPSHPRFLM